MTSDTFERWENFDGRQMTVQIRRRTITTEDNCPECGGGIRIAVAKAEGGEQVFRIECLSCGWLSEALPDPQA